MGPVIYQQFLSSTFNVADGFKYANMKSFITDKFNVQMRPQLLVQFYCWRIPSDQYTVL